MQFTFDQSVIESCDNIKFCNNIQSCGKVNAADDIEPMDTQELIDDKCDMLDDDFDYVLAGIDKLCREGKYRKALDIIETVSDILNATIADIGDSFAAEAED